MDVDVSDGASSLASSFSINRVSEYLSSSLMMPLSGTVDKHKHPGVSPPPLSCLL